MAEGTSLSDDEFRELETFICRTPRGRTFLDTYAERSRTVAASQVLGAIADLKALWQRHEEARSHAQRIDVLRRELQDMSASIAQARREIAAIRPKEGDDRIETAANELDAIVMSTERASIEILGSAERILEATEHVKLVAPGKDVDTIEGEVMNIFTACSFQDLTGQRTTKVVNALRYIEQRIMTLMDLWDVGGTTGQVLVPEKKDERPDAHLLHGPSDDGIDQSAVDALLGGLFPDVPAATAAMAAPAVESAPNPPVPNPSVPKAPMVEVVVETVKLDQSSIDDLFA